MTLTKVIKSFAANNIYNIILFFLVLNFQFNFFNNVSDDAFNSFQLDSEALSVGRIVKSDKDGIFSFGGFHGRLNHKDQRLQKYSAYYISSDGVGEDGFEPYYSQSGLQSMTYSIIEHFLRLDIITAINLFQLLNSVLMTIVLIFFLRWINGIWRIKVIVGTFFFISFSFWLTLFSRNIYWVTWVFFLPFVLNLNYLKTLSKHYASSVWKTFGLFLGVFLFKCLFNGFEYITTVIISAFCPFVFYFFYDKRKIKKILLHFVAAGMGVFSAIVSAIVILAFQLSFVKGSFMNGINYIIYSLGKRSPVISSQNMPKIIDESLNSSMAGVLKTYLAGDIFNICHWTILGSNSHLFNISFATFIILSCIAGIGLFTMKPKEGEDLYLANKALALMLLFSFLAPISWFTLFKGHSYIHVHMNFLVWYIPSMLIAFSVVTIFAMLLFNEIKYLFFRHQ